MFLPLWGIKINIKRTTDFHLQSSMKLQQSGEVRTIQEISHRFVKLSQVTLILVGVWIPGPPGPATPLIPPLFANICEKLEVRYLTSSFARASQSCSSSEHLYHKAILRDIYMLQDGPTKCGRLKGFILKKQLTDIVKDLVSAFTAYLRLPVFWFMSCNASKLDTCLSSVLSTTNLPHTL